MNNGGVLFFQAAGNDPIPFNLNCTNFFLQHFILPWIQSCYNHLSFISSRTVQWNLIILTNSGVQYPDCIMTSTAFL